MFVRMFRRKIMTLACVLAYLVVFAHSAIAHEHHRMCLSGALTSESSETHHDPHYGSCETLNTFLLDTDYANDLVVDCIPVFMPAASLSEVPPQSFSILPVQFLYLEIFREPLIPGANSLMAPPAM